MIQNALVGFPVGRGLKSLDILLSFKFYIIPALGDKSCVPLNISVGARPSGSLETNAIVHGYVRGISGNF